MENGSTATEPREHSGRAPDEALPGDEGAPEQVEQLSIEGDGNLTATVGGRRPDEAVLTIQGGEIKMGKGQFDKGQRVRLVVEGYVAEIHSKDVRDPKTGQIAKSKKKHVVKADFMERVPLLEDEA